MEHNKDFVDPSRSDNELESMLKTNEHENILGNPYRPKVLFRDLLKPTFNQVDQSDVPIVWHRFQKYLWLLPLPVFMMAITSTIVNKSVVFLSLLSKPYIQLGISTLSYIAGLKTAIPRPSRPFYSHLYYTMTKSRRLRRKRFTRHLIWWGTRYPVFMLTTFLGSQILQTNELKPTLTVGAISHLIIFNRRPWAKLIKYPFGAFLTGFTAVVLVETAYGKHNKWLLFNPGTVKLPEHIYDGVQRIKDKSPIEATIAAKDFGVDTVISTKNLIKNVAGTISNTSSDVVFGKTISEIKDDLMSSYYKLFTYAIASQEFTPKEEISSSTVRPTINDIESSVSISAFMNKNVGKDSEDTQNYTFLDNVSQRDYETESNVTRLTSLMSGVRFIGRGWITPKVPDSVYKVKERMQDYVHQDETYQNRDYNRYEKDVNQDKTLTPEKAVVTLMKDELKDSKSNLKTNLYSMVGGIFKK